jgi:hypothetical protein
MKHQHTIVIDEGQRQAILLALGHLAVKRPGWDHLLSEIASKMDNCAGGRPEMFEGFKRMYNEPKLPPCDIPGVCGDETAEYKIAEDGRSILCKKCRLRSFNLNDVRERYCGECKSFHNRPQA